MHLPNKKGWFAIFFIIATLAIPFAITFYVSTDGYKEKMIGWHRANREAGIPSKSKLSSEQVLLVKNEKITIDKTSLVFKGISDKTVCMDLYLLELDPDIPYTLKFTKQSVKDGIWLGNILYELISVKDNILKLKIQDSYNTL